MRVLVTGSTGKAGRFTVRELAQNGHEVFHIAASDTCIDVRFAQAFTERFGTTPNLAPGFGEFQSAFDCSKIKNAFGWVAKHSWRDQ